MVTDITCGIRVGRYQPATIAHLDGVGIEGRPVAIALVEHMHYDIVGVLVLEHHLAAIDAHIRLLVGKAIVGYHLPLGTASSNLCLGIRQRVGERLVVTLLPVGILVGGIIIFAT